MAAILELFLVRHAIAAERGPKFPDDSLRPLTPDGVARFQQAVAGLAALGLQLDVVLTSPYARAMGTARLLADGLSPKPPVEELAALAPGARHAAVVDALKAQPKRRRRIALVGHEPDLGELAARLLGARGHVEFKKGAVCAIDVSATMPGGPGMLRWFLTPKQLRRLAP